MCVQFDYKRKIISFNVYLSVTLLCLKCTICIFYSVYEFSARTYIVFKYVSLRISFVLDKNV